MPLMVPGQMADFRPYSCKGFECYLKHAYIHHLTHTRPGQELFLQIWQRTFSEYQRYTTHVQEVFTYAVLSLHDSNCERHRYPHIPEPGISELEHALEIALNRPSLEFPLQYSKTRVALITFYSCSLNHNGPLTCRFFSINTCTVWIRGWESRDVEDRPYELIYTILYRGLEHLGILVSMGAGVLETIPMDTNEELSFRKVKSYIFDCAWRSAPQSVLFKSQLYLHNS